MSNFAIFVFGTYALQTSICSLSNYIAFILSGTYNKSQELVAFGSFSGNLIGVCMDNNIKELFDAVNNGDIEKVRLNIGAGVDVKDKSGQTPLHRAAFHGHTEIARLLLERGADVHMQDEIGWTPLHLAAFFDKTEIVKLLREVMEEKAIADRWSDLENRRLVAINMMGENNSGQIQKRQKSQPKIK